jgi:hypothetical protein
LLAWEPPIRAQNDRDRALRAEALLREAVRLDPEFLWASRWLAEAIYGATMFDPARAPETWPERRAILGRLASDAPQAWFRHQMRFVLLREPVNGPPDWLAVEESLAAARESAPPSAMRELDVRRGGFLGAVGRVSEALPYIRANLRDDPLSLQRSQEAFEDLVRDLGLVEYWRATGEWGDFCRPLGTEDFECF